MTASGELTWAAVLAAKRHGGPREVLTLLAGYGEKERRALVPDLKAALKSRGQASWEVRRHNRADEGLLRVCGAACLGGPAAIAQWLTRADLRVVQWPWMQERVVEALAMRPEAWGPEVARRLADRLSAASNNADWVLVDRLHRALDLAPPTNSRYVSGWIDGYTLAQDPADLVPRLHADAYARVMVPLLFEADEIGRRIDEHDRTRRQLPDQQWSYAITGGIVDRDTVVDACLSRLLRGAPAADIRGFVRVYEALALTDDEIAARTVTFLRLLPDAYATVAAIAQAALRRMDESGALTADQVVEATRSLLFRPEKKLVRAQFTWLDKAVARHRDRGGELLAAATTVFTHTDAGLHDRALKSFALHLPKLTEDQAVLARAELRASLDMLGGPSRAEAAALLGDEPASVAIDVPGPPPFVPREVPPEIASLDELVAELTAATAAPGGMWWSVDALPDPWGVERLVTAVLREHARDREALVAALRPLANKNEPFMYGSARDEVPANLRHALLRIVRSACDPRGVTEWFRGLFGKGAAAPTFPDSMAGPQRALMARLFEVTRRLRAPRPDAYLARPAGVSGCVDPAEFVHGLEAYEAAGRTPWACDFEQALLRLPRAVDPDVVARAGRLSSPAGVAAWEVMVSGGIADPAVTPGHCRRARWRHEPGTEQYRVADVGPAPASFARGLLGPYLFDVATVGRTVDNEVMFNWHTDVLCWPMVMPTHRDVVAAHAIPVLMGAPESGRPTCAVLPYLAEADGPVGDGLATALAYGLVARTAEDRVGAVAAFVTLASRDDGTGDALPVGTALADLVALGQVKPNRLHDSVRQAMDAGCHAAGWRLMSEVLPVLLADRAKASRLGDLVGLAAECASRTGARGTVAGLEAFATAKGSSRVTVEARRLHAVLAGV